MQLTEFAKQTLADRYMTDDDSTPYDVFTRAVNSYSTGAHNDRMQQYVDDQWFIPSTPVLANGGTVRGNPIACFLNRVPDSRGGINGHYAETAWLASNGGGVGGYWGALRSTGMSTSAGSASNGMLPFLGVVDRLVLAFAQGKTRRASYAAFLPISHPEIVQFIEMRKPTGGDINRKNLNLHHGVCISDEFYDALDRDADWHLVDPHTKETVQVLRARWLWELLLETRSFMGEPYIVNTDAMMDGRPDVLKVLEVPVDTTNLCTEITTATVMPDGSYTNGVCCLGSINLLKYNEFKNNYQFIEDCLRYLDNVLQAFIDGPSKGDEEAKRGAAFYRDVGLGTLGLHSLYQTTKIPADSAMAYSLNKQIFKNIRKFADRANSALAIELGACPAAKQAGLLRRFTHMLAVAPNASTSIFVNTSPGIEPYVTNGFIRKTASGTEIVLNPILRSELECAGLLTDDIVTSIIINNGSVQHLDQILPQWMLDVYKTAFELGQMHLVQQALDRMPYIDQAQSLNLFFPPGTSRSYYNKVHRHARKLKTLYYVRGVTAHKASTGEKVQAIVQDTSDSDMECLACAN